MEKTSREYAEKLAEEYCSSDVENFDSQSLYVGKSKQEIFAEGYLKAVEETNVKELREALEFLIKSINPQDVTPHRKFKGVDLGELYVGGASIPSNEAIHKAINALNKNKS